MRVGHRTHLLTGKIDYKRLRKINPEAARRAVLDYLKSDGHNISQAALVFGINRTVVYDILWKEKEGNLKDRPRAPRNQPRRTPARLKTRSLRLNVGPGMGQKGYRAISSSMKVYPFLRGQLDILSGETKIRLHIFLGITSGKRKGSLSTGIQLDPLKSCR